MDGGHLLPSPRSCPVGSPSRAIRSSPSEMDFDRLPNEIFLQIFEHLPFKERVRIARVSRRFKFVSEMAISQTKSLNLTAPIFRGVKSKSMSKLFQLCAANQQQVICHVPHASHGRYRSTMLKRVGLFSDIPHRRLQFIDLDTRNGTERDYHIVRDLLVKHSNLLALEWSYPNGPFPNVVYEKLECLMLRLCSNDHSFLASIVDSCPKLDRLVLIWSCQQDLPRWEEILNDVLAKTPEMKALGMVTLSPNTFNMEKIENIWKLSSLQTLIVGDYFRVSDQMMIKISTAFPLLEVLSFAAKKKMAANGAIAFKILKHLREIKIYFEDIDTVDKYALQMAKCDRLQIVQICGAVLMSTTVAAFVDGCPLLESLKLWFIRDIDSLETAIAFVKSLDGFVQESLNIQLKFYAQFWQSDEVQSTLAEINETNGRQIIFDGPVLDPPINVDEECGGDQESLQIKPKMSLGRRLIKAIRKLPRKMAKVFN